MDLTNSNHKAHSTMSLGVTPPIPQLLKGARRAWPQPPAHLPPRALQLTDIQLQKKWEKSGCLAIFVFISALSCVLYYLMLCLGWGGVKQKVGTRCGAPVSRLQNALEINVSLFSGLSFTTAKTVDIISNLVVGQGGRALHGWIA